MGYEVQSSYKYLYIYIFYIYILFNALSRKENLNCKTHVVDFWYFALFRAGLSKDLQTKLHGQHLAQSVVLKAIQGFINNPESNKPLTLSFHGWSGTGKNFVARMIADNLYRDGVKSECVRLFIAPFHFPHTRLVDAYKVRRAQGSLLKGCGSVPASCWQYFQDPAHSVRCFVPVCVYLTDEW